MSKPRKPRDIDKHSVGDGYGFWSMLDDDPLQPRAEGHFQTVHARDLRRLAKWCEQAAAWLEAKR